MKAMRLEMYGDPTAKGAVGAPKKAWLAVSCKRHGNLWSMCCLAVVGLAALLHAPVSSGGECLAGDREVKGMATYSGVVQVLDIRSLRIRSFVCEVDDETDVRVELHRLNDGMVGDLLEGRESRFAKKVLGKFSIQKNAVYDEVKTLFDRFGVQDTDARTWTARDTRGPEHEGYEGSNQGVEITTFLGRDPDFLPNFPLPDEMRELRSGRDWLRDFNFAYGHDSSWMRWGITLLDIKVACPAVPPDQWDHFNCLTFWRPMTREDAEKYAPHWKELNELVGADPDDAVYVPDPDLSLFLYLTKGGWPADFSYIIGEAGTHEAGMLFTYVPRRMYLDVTVIENLSKADVSLDGLFGKSIVSKRLRAVDEAQERSGSRADQVAKDLGRLGPGEKLLVPLRMLFSPGDLFGPLLTPDDDFIKAARAVYDRIRTLDPGPQGFRYDALKRKRDDPDIAYYARLKRPEDYKEPSYPTAKVYVYGPEIVLRGIKVNGERLDLQGQDPNMLAMTTSCDCGSCPYLHAWSDRLGRWVSYGKVIHEAQGAELQAEEEVNLAELATRFRIAERELELSHIDQVRLQLELGDGRTIELVPEIPALNRVDGDYAEIYAGDTVELEFTLPDAIAKEDIRSSSLSVNGYYQLYTSPEMLARLPRLPVSE